MNTLCLIVLCDLGVGGARRVLLSVLANTLAKAPATSAKGEDVQPIYPPADFGGPPPSPKHLGRGGLIAIVAATALISGGLGTAVGALVIKSTSSNDAAAQTAQPANGAGARATGDTHAQDVGLCTRYAAINSAIPKPYDNAMDILPASSALQAALEDYPGASEPIQQAMSDVVSAYYARIAVFGGVPRQGLAEPPPDDRQSAQAAYDKAWEICGFDEG